MIGNGKQKNKRNNIMKNKIKVSETDIKRQIKDYLSYCSNTFCFSLLGGLGSFPGQPDIIVIQDAKVFFVEVKTFNGKQSPAQIDFEAKLQHAGGKYILVHNLEEFIQKSKCEN